MDAEEKDEFQAELKRWRSSAITKEVIQQLRDKSDECLVHLLAECEATTDPKVAALFGRYDTHKRLIASLTEGELDG